MTKIICVGIKIWPKSVVISATDNSIETQPGTEAIKIKLLRNAEYEISDTDTENGFVQNFTMSAIIDNDDANKIKNYKRSLILELKTNDNSNIVIGSPDFPAKATFVTNVNYTTVTFTHRRPE